MNLRRAFSCLLRHPLLFLRWHGGGCCIWHYYGIAYGDDVQLARTFVQSLVNAQRSAGRRDPDACLRDLARWVVERDWMIPAFTALNDLEADLLAMAAGGLTEEEFRETWQARMGRDDTRRNHQAANQGHHAPQSEIGPADRASPAGPAP